MNIHLDTETLGGDEEEEEEEEEEEAAVVDGVASLKKMKLEICFDVYVIDRILELTF